MTISSVFILGAGGHSKVLIDCLQTDNYLHILGILDINSALHGKKILDVPVVGSEDEILKRYSPRDVKLVNGVGSAALIGIERRKKIYDIFKSAGFDFLHVMHQTVCIGRDVQLEEGVQLMARSTLQPGCRIGKNVIVNTNAIIDHDCEIGNHVHVAPGVVCCGGVTIGAGTHVGSGATIMQGVQIGENCLIAAGAVVTRDVASQHKVAGIPAKIME